jgi:hypothetical protein
MRDGAERFAQQWGAKTVGLGWTFDELFVLVEPFANVSLQGAAWFVGDSSITAVTADAITLRTEGGATQRIYRKSRVERPTPWAGRAMKVRQQQFLGRHFVCVGIANGDETGCDAWRLSYGKPRSPRSSERVSSKRMRAMTIEPCWALSMASWTGRWIRDAKRAGNYAYRCREI